MRHKRSKYVWSDIGDVWRLDGHTFAVRMDPSPIVPAYCWEPGRVLANGKFLSMGVRFNTLGSAQVHCEMAAERTSS